MKVPINFEEISSRDLLRLAKKCCRKLTEREIYTWKVIDNIPKGDRNDL